MEKFKGGSGMEKRVALSGRNPDRVTARFHEKAPSPRHVKARHYLTKILSLLFADNIPQIRMSSTDPHEIEIDRKDWDKDHAKMQRIKRRGAAVVFTPWSIVTMLRMDQKFNKDPKAQDFLTRISKIIKSGQSVMDLNASHNYTRDQHGNLYYLDSFEPWSYNKDKSPNAPSFDVDLLRTEIENLPEEKRKNALTFFARLIALWGEEQAAFTENKKPFP